MIEELKKVSPDVEVRVATSSGVEDIKSVQTMGYHDRVNIVTAD